GSLWLATPEGISHYGNGKFTNYGPADGVAATAYGQAFSDGHGRMWFAVSWRAGRGAVMFDGKTFRNFTTESGLGGDYVGGFVSSPDGTVWMGTEKGVSVWDGQRFTNYDRSFFKDRMANANVNCILRDRRGIFWLGTSAGATRFDGVAWSTLTA